MIQNKTVFKWLLAGSVVAVALYIYYFYVYAAADATNSAPASEAMLATPMDDKGDGSAGGNVSGGPDIREAPGMICDCRWESGIVSAPPFTIGGNKANGICFFMRDGETVFGNLDTASKVCHGVYKGKPDSSSSYSFLTGSACDPLFLARPHCGPPGVVPTSGICMTKDGRFGTIRTRNGMWGCSSSNGQDAKEVCADFKYEAPGRARCSIPDTPTIMK